MKEQFLKFVQQHQLYNTGQVVLAAVSGGVDSVVLCKLLQLSNQSFAIAHCNYQLRDKDADTDEQFVKELAAEYGVAFHTVRFDTQKIAVESSQSIQMIARDLRYKWFQEIMQQNNYAAVATAHHLNDSIETVLLNLTKGTGIYGLQGIPVRNDKVVRPMLCFSREQIESFAGENKLVYRTDSSNKTDKYQRNKIRNQVVPVLSAINPALTSSFQKNIEHFNDALVLYTQAVARQKMKLVENRGEEVWLNIARLKNVQPARTILFEILKQYEFNAAQCESILNCLSTTEQKVFFSATHRLVKERRYIIINSLAQPKSDSIFLINESDKVLQLNHGVKLKLTKKEVTAGFQIPKNPDVISLDLSKITFPLTVRKWRQGDYFYPLGMNNKKKKVTDFFQQLKLSIAEKDQQWLLFSDNKLCCIAGQRPDERFKITAATKTVLQIEISREG